MKFIFATALICELILLAGCDLDNFLFNTQQLESYTLPGNTIADSLLEEVRFLSDGNALYGYWIKSNGQRPGLALIYCHGNKHNLDEYWDRVLIMHEIGCNLLIFDYRGFGKSEGESSEQGIYSDAKAALAITMGKGFSADSIIVMGYSLGNVPAIYLAADVIQPKALISEAPFASANSLTQSALGLDIPTGWLTTGNFDNSERIRNISTPFLLIHGDADDFVRWRDNGKIIYDHAPDPKRLMLVQGGNHTDLPDIIGRNNYIALLKEWIL